MRETSSEFLNRTSREYGIYVVDHRGIPTLGDGLKSSQRIALWVLRTIPKPIKTMALVGEMMGSNLYVHGDASAADAVSKLAAPYLNNVPLIQGKGQFGTRIDPANGIGAPRYTEVVRSEFAEKNLYLDIDILPMVENYDGSTMMPETFLPVLPLVLLNGVSGIAVGWSTEILPHRLEDIRKATAEVLKTGKLKKPLVPFYQNYNVTVIPSDEGPNKWIICGKLEIVNTTTIRIIELPPDQTLDAFKARLIKMEEDKKIVDFTDRSRDKIDIVVRMTRAALGGKTVEQLLTLFKLRSSTTERLVVHHQGRPIQYQNHEELIRAFVEWRLQWYLTRYEHLKKIEIDTTIFLRTFLACYTHSDVAKTISGFSGKTTLKAGIAKAATSAKVPVVEEIIERVSSLPAYRWTKESRDDAEKKLAECLTKIKELDRIIGDPQARKDIYLKEIGA